MANVIPDTNNVQVALITATMQIVLGSGGGSLEVRLSDFDRIYKSLARTIREAHAEEDEEGDRVPAPRKTRPRSAPLG